MPAQNIAGMVELSTSTLRIFLNLRSKYSVNSPLFESRCGTRSAAILRVHTSPFLSRSHHRKRSRESDLPIPGSVLPACRTFLFYSRGIPRISCGLANPSYHGVLCADTKLVLSWIIGNRDAGIFYTFMSDLESRLRNRIQLPTDGHGAAPTNLAILARSY